MNKKEINNKIFIATLLIISCGILFQLSRNSNEYNYVDNRTSYKFSFPTIKSLLSNEYQSHFEDVIADQLPKYNYFKLVYLKITNYVNFGTIYLFKLDKLDKYINLESINLYKEYLLYNTTTEANFKKVSSNDIDEINNIAANTNANIYLYFVETDANYNFETNHKVEIIDYFEQNLKINKKNIAVYQLSSYNDYQEFFYKTDHHWNYKGSFEGYKQISNLMNFNYILEPQDEICFEKVKSYGSKSKSIAGINILNDKMCMYEYQYPQFEIYASGKKILDYGKTAEELKKSSEISYASIYGGDYDELVFINKEAHNNKKLLIYSNSYSNAINKLLASNYQETYVIDGRYYKEKSMIDYINNHTIDDVLILGNCMLFADDIKW